MHYLPDKKLRHFHVPGYVPDWFALIVINHGQDLTKKFGSSYHSEVSELLYVRNHHQTQLTQIICTILTFIRPPTTYHENYQS